MNKELKTYIIYKLWLVDNNSKLKEKELIEFTLSHHDNINRVELLYCDDRGATIESTIYNYIICTKDINGNTIRIEKNDILTAYKNENDFMNGYNPVGIIEEILTDNSFIEYDRLYIILGGIGITGFHILKTK